ncbi:adenosine deaminase [candidate division KSB1 bacterium]|nr:adenosine deaminase [candidate division KSB1 bacterium]
MPKAELHLHLEGTIRPETALELMRRNNSPSLPEQPDQIKNLYRFRNLAEFVNSMRSVTNNIRFLEDLQKITLEMLTSLAIQNVKYVEFDCAVQKYIDMGYTLKEVVESIYQTVVEFQADHDIAVKMVVNIQRLYGGKEAIQLIEKIALLNHPFIVGIGLSGDEAKYPPDLFTEAFLLAQQLDLHRTAHAGEAVGPKSVWNALKCLNVERIDHGTRAIEDPDLVDHLSRHKIPLTQCLTSNLRLNVVKKINDHPFYTFYKKGIPVSLNTDDPQIFNTELTQEYILAAEIYQLDKQDLENLVMNGLRAAFLPDEEKSQIITEVCSEFRTLSNDEGDHHE